MNLLQLRSIHKAYGAKILFEKETVSIGMGSHIGVIGPNGAGKTTLFRAITGEEELDEGEVVRSSQLRLGYLPQHDLWEQGETVAQFLDKDSEIPPWELKQLGVGLGLTNQHFDTAITSLSGGYRMRVKLLRMLSLRPNLMLLDEPTNYLDLETLMVLEEFLKRSPAAFLLISHDRTFLRKTTNAIVEVEQGEVHQFSGGLDAYMEAKRIKREELEKQKAAQDLERKEILAFAARFRAQATKAKQVQSRLKRLEKMEEIEIKAGPARAAIRIPEPTKTGKRVMEVDQAHFGYGDKRILNAVQMIIQRGDHVGVVGVNGAGKTTLLRGLSQDLAPQGGSVKWGMDVEIGYYAQHVIEGLDLNDTVMTSLEAAAHTDIRPQEVQDLAGALMFSGADFHKSLSVLSGGELARVALGRILLKRAPCLILDEPTNHLDFETVDTLAQALRDYPGTVIIVSHDRDFLKRSAKQILEVRDGRVTLYRGTYDDYLWSLEKGGLKILDEIMPAPAKKKVDSKTKERVKGGRKEAQKELNKKIRGLKKNVEGHEKKMAKLSREMSEISDQLSELEGPELMKASQRIGEVQSQLHTLEGEWEKDSLALEKAEKELAALP